MNLAVNLGMGPGFRLGRTRRAAVALTAAYALALHALLLTFVPPQLAALADALTVLCAAGAPEDGGHPAGHPGPCPAVCAAVGQGLVGPLPACAGALAVPRAGDAAQVAPPDWTAPRLVAVWPPPPRGPPAA
jgi:hypothetical protein